MRNNPVDNKSGRRLRNGWKIDAVNREANEGSVRRASQATLRPLLSPLLYLFSNAELLQMCHGSGINTSAIGFVEDVNVLAYNTSMEENCKNA